MAPAPRVGLADISLRSLSSLSVPGVAPIAALAPALRALDRVGLCSLDPWGDMTFEHALGVLQESPWERLRRVAVHVTHTPLRLTLRGRCLLGFRPHEWNVIEAFVRQAVDCGVTSFLVYEPLNDAAALSRMAGVVREAGAAPTLAAVHTAADPDPVGRTATLAGKLAAEGPEGICLVVPRTLGPRSARELVAALCETTTLPLEVDFDNGAGLAACASLAAIEAGADVVRVSAAPGRLDPSALPVGELLPALDDMGVEVDADVDALTAAMTALAPFCEEAARGAASPTAPPQPPADFRHLADVPGALVAQVGERLHEHGAAGRLNEVLAEVARVQSEIGEPPLVAPLGQIVATQAVLNVVYGGRWQVVPDEMKALVRGEYGEVPGALATEVVQALIDPLAGQAAESLEVGFDPSGSVADPADALLLTLAPAAAPGFLARRQAAMDVDLSSLLAKGAEDQDWEDRWRDLGPDQVRELVTLIEASSVDEVTVESKGTKVTVRKSAPVAMNAPVGFAPAAPSAGIAGATVVPAGPGLGDGLGADGGSVVRASMVGTFYRAAAPGANPFVEVGSRVVKGDVLCVLEAMKLMNELVAETAGTITAILADDGSAVEYGQPLFVLQSDG